MTKAVIPAAGLGTRFLPATKAQPKEMLPVIDKPAIQYVVEEAVRAGIEDICIVTSSSKRSLEDHFDRNFELEHLLASKGKDAERDEVVALAELADFHYVRQGEPLGLGHAVSVARRHVGDHPFVVLLGDEFMAEGSGLLEGMIATHDAARLLGARPDGGGGRRDRPLRQRRRRAVRRPAGEGQRRGREAEAGRGPVATSRSWAATCSPPRSSTTSPT